jgi:RNA polymerase-binding transcription factor DksA
VRREADRKDDPGTGIARLTHTRSGTVDTSTARLRLEELLGELTRSIATLQGERTNEEDPGLDTRSADPGAALSDSDREEAVIEAMERQRTQVEAALGRVEAGTYGRCIDCGEELPPERLEARPEAARCVADQAKSENGR